MTKKKTTYLLRDLDVTFWSYVKAKAAREQISVKALLVKLLGKWLGAGCLVITITGCGDSPLAPSSPREPAITRDLPNCTQLTATETTATYTCTNPGGVPQPVACTIEGNVITCHVVIA